MLPADFVLLRGLGREGRHWGDFIPLLQKQPFCHSVICIDLPGFGKFNQLTSPLTIDSIAEFVVTQLENHSSENRVLLSVSLGAMVAASLLSHHEGLFNKAILMNTSFSNLSPVYHRMQMRSLKYFFLAAKAGSDLEQREKQILKMVSNSPEKIEKLSKDWAEIARTRPSTLSNVLRQIIAASRFKLPAKMPNTPIVVFRSLGDKMVHPSCSEKFADYWGLDLLTQSSAGHDLCIDDPDWVIAKIEKVL